MPVIQTIIIEDEAACGDKARCFFKGAAISINLSTDMNDRISTDTLKNMFFLFFQWFTKLIKLNIPWNQLFHPESAHLLFQQFLTSFPIVFLNIYIWNINKYLSWNAKITFQYIVSFGIMSVYANSLFLFKNFKTLQKYSYWNITLYSKFFYNYFLIISTKTER